MVLLALTDTTTKTIEELLDLARTTEDPRTRLEFLAELTERTDEVRSEIRTIRRDLVRELRRDGEGFQWSEIGILLGVSAQRAEQLSR